MSGIFKDIFGSSNTTDQSTTSSSSGTANYSNSGTSAVTPTLDPSMQPLIPQIAGATSDQFTSPTGAVAGAEGLGALEPGYLNWASGVNQNLQDETQMSPTTTSAVSALQQTPNVSYNASGVPSVSAQTIGPTNVTGSDILADENPFQQSVVSSSLNQADLQNQIQLAQLQAQQASGGAGGFGDRSGIAQSTLIGQQGLNTDSMIANLESQGYTTAQAQAEADAARALATGQSNQGANLTAQQSNQAAGLTEAQGSLAGQEAQAQLAQSGQIAAGQLGQSGQQIAAAGSNAEIANSANAAGVMTGLVGAPIAAISGLANTVYGSPMGQTGTQSTTGTATQNTSGTSTGTSTTTAAPSLFQDAGNLAALGSKLKDGGLIRRADGGALDVDSDNSDPPGALDPGVSDWFAGRVHSSDMGPASSAPSDVPGLDPQLGVDAAALKYARNAPASPPPSTGGFKGALDRFAERVENSPFSQLMGGIGQTGDVSTGIAAIQAHRKGLADVAQTEQQTAQGQESLAEQKFRFGLMAPILQQAYGQTPGGGPGSASPDTDTVAAPLVGAQTVPLQVPTGPGYPRSSPGGTPQSNFGAAPTKGNASLTLEGLQNDVAFYRRQAMLDSVTNVQSGAKEALVEAQKRITNALDGTGTVYNPASNTFSQLPGIGQSKATAAGLTSAAMSQASLPAEIAKAQASAAASAAAGAQYDVVQIPDPKNPNRMLTVRKSQVPGMIPNAAPAPGVVAPAPASGAVGASPAQSAATPDVGIPGGPSPAGEQNIKMGAATGALTAHLQSLNRLKATAQELMNHPGLGGITGAWGATPRLPGTDATNAAAIMQQLQGNAITDTFNSARELSKTGGGFGRLTTTEIPFFQNVQGSLNEKQSAPALRKNLQKIIDYANTSIANDTGTFKQTYGKDYVPPGAAPVTVAKPDYSKLPKGYVPLPDGRVRLPGPGNRVMKWQP